MTEKNASQMVLHSQSVPLLLNHILIQIDLQDSQKGLASPPVHSEAFRITQLLADEWRMIQTSRIRAHHLSWDKIVRKLSVKFGITFTTDTAELGWICPPLAESLPEQYCKIVDEVSFHNAIGVLHSQTSCNNRVGKFVLLLWSPKPQDPVSLQSPHVPLRIEEEDTVDGVQILGEVNIIPVLGTVENQVADDEEPRTDLRIDEPSKVHIPREKIEFALDTSKSSDELGQAEDDEVVDDDVILLDASIDDQIPTSATEDDDELAIDINKLVDQYGQEDDQAPEQYENEEEDAFQERLNSWQQAKADEATIRLAREMDTEVCMHLSEDIWGDVCRFFNHTPERREAAYIVDVMGFGRKLLPVQAHAVYWAFLKFNGIEGSVFLGHVMGIGKTTIACALHHIQHRINHIYDHIRRFPNQHLSHDLQASDAQCPSNDLVLKKYGFDCVCAMNSPTSFMAQKLGFTSMLAPLGLLDNWVREASYCFPKVADGTTGNELDCILIKAHGNSSWKPAILKDICGYEIEQNTADNKPLPSKIRPRLCNSKIFVLTTSNSFQSRVLNALQKNRTWIFQPEGVQKRNNKGILYTTKPNSVQRKTPDYPLAIVNLQMRDEFHLEKNPSSSSITAINQLMKWQDVKTFPIRLCPMSGTPLCTGPGDMAQYIKCMVRPEWRNHLLLRKWMDDEAVELGESWDRECKMRTIRPDYTRATVERFQPLYEQLMLRFTTKSNFLGAGPVVKVPTNAYVSVACQNPAWEERLNDAQKEEDSRLKKAEHARRERWKKDHGGNMSKYVPLQNNLPGSYHRQRLYASIPGLMDLTYESGKPLGLTGQEWIYNTRQSTQSDELWQQETASDPYFTNIKKLSDSSMKLAKIGDIIMKFKYTIDAEGKPARLVFASYFMPAAYVIYLYMVYILKIDKKDIAFTHKGMNESRISKELAKFCGAEGKEPTARYLVGTTSTFGTGLTLNMAIGLGLLEPDFRLSTMIQLYGRHCRQGNKNQKTWTWQFIAANNAIEDKIIEVNDLRGKIAKVEMRKVTEGMLE